MAEALGQGVTLSKVHVPLGQDGVSHAAIAGTVFTEDPARGESGRASSSILIHQSTQSGGKGDRSNNQER